VRSPRRPSPRTPREDPPPHRHEWERPAIFAFGIVFIVLLVILAIFFPNPTPFQFEVFKTVLALAAAGIAALIPGLLNVDLPAVRATGALAVLILVYKFSPAALIVPTPPTPQPTPVVVNYKICSGEYERNCPPHDIYQYCYEDPQKWAQNKCASAVVHNPGSSGGNKCGYTMYEVICTGPK
jgi:hypothetical protein